MKKQKGICHFADCKKVALYGFRHRKSNRLQQETYCRKHADIIKSNKAFPECRISSLKYKEVILPPHIADELDFIDKRKQREIMKELLLNSG